MSVSQFTKLFQEKQDWKAIAKKSAAKKTREGQPTTAEELMKEWNRKRDESARIGTLYHSIREQETVNQNQPVFYNTPCQVRRCNFDEKYKYSIPIHQLENGISYPELMIYDLEYGVCGQADNIVVADGKINVLDYKTDREIAFSAYSSKWVSPRKFLPPLSHLDDCNGNMYSLKMSLYMYMLWKSNKGRFKPGEIKIEHVHLLRDDDNNIILENNLPIVVMIESIDLPYRKKEVTDMLQTLKLNNQ